MGLEVDVKRRGLFRVGIRPRKQLSTALLNSKLRAPKRKSREDAGNPEGVAGDLTGEAGERLCRGLVLRRTAETTLCPAPRRAGGRDRSTADRPARRAGTAQRPARTPPSVRQLDLRAPGPG